MAMEPLKTTAPTKITATELARNLSDILNRVRYKGESFHIERKGELIAEIKPKKVSTMRDLIEFFQTHPAPDPDFWNDVEKAHNAQGVMPPPPEWPA